MAQFKYILQIMWEFCSILDIRVFVTKQEAHKYPAVGNLLRNFNTMWYNRAQTQQVFKRIFNIKNYFRRSRDGPSNEVQTAEMAKKTEDPEMPS